jgi:hypothetical protein
MTTREADFLTRHPIIQVRRGKTTHENGGCPTMLIIVNATFAPAVRDRDWVEVMTGCDTSGWPVNPQLELRIPSCY